MKAIEQTYTCLLTEIGLDRGFPTIRGSAFESLSWCVNDAPKLEKQLLQYIETGIPKWENWPRWLVPLRDRFLRDENPLDLRALRQLLLFSYKAEHIYTDETEAQVISNWRSCNADVGSWGECFNTQSPTLLQRAKKHCSAVLGNQDWSSIVPFHGPGAVYDGNDNKGLWSKWFTTIDHCYPYCDFMSVSRHLMGEECKLEVDDTIVARLIAVPKDSRGPRLICVHPTEAVWIQQGLRIKLEHAINHSCNKRYHRAWPQPKGHVHFDDQTVNARLALKASLDRSYGTLDLKEASDRLSDRLVQYLFGRHYRWFGCCRATSVEIRLKGQSGPPLKEEIHSYAPMGNATTFPVQALVFWSICVATMEARGFHQPADCHVFGDDLIIPTEMVPYCIDSLESFGLVVNREKSFYRGAFRESCGTDAYKGVDVTPVRWKTTYEPSSLTGLQSLSSIAQRLRVQGYEQASKEVYSILSRKLRRLNLSLTCTNDPDHGGIAEFTENAHSVWRDAYWHFSTRVSKPGYQMYVSPILRLSEPAVRFQHDWNHVLSSLTSLEKTGRSNDPSSTPSRRTGLIRGWARVL